MTTKRALRIILVIALGGAAFSGTLTYQELFAEGSAGTILGDPACVYGFLMYLLVSGIAAWGLAAKRRESANRPHRA